ncbi:MAG: insulinase family protein [bacterium]|nr:insulinase family protein [bacterium]
MNLRHLPALIVTTALLVGVTTAAGAAAAPAFDLPDLKYEKYTLANGLQVILHEDHSLPTAAVNVWYHVGSKDEKPGRTGFAHLFEHMMFQGSQNHDKDYFLPLQKVGGQVNGSTNNDRTNYWENVPADQLELALFLEADRMGWLLPAMTQEKLDNQRDVVKNEKRQGENRPYAKSRDMLLELMYDVGHPYRWPVIGSMDDLSAASLEDVAEFFRLYYAPNNASLCVAGSFDPAQAKEWIAKYFGPIPPGRPVDRLEAWIPRLDGERRAVAEDAVELPRLYMQWHSPGWYREGDAEFDLLAELVASGKTSRLYKSLVYEKRIAQDIFSMQSSREMSGTFGITATAAPGHDLAELEAAIDAELSQLLAEGVTKSEVDLARTRLRASSVRELQQIGGFGGKADRLNRYNVLVGDPGYLKADLARYDAADVGSVNAWLRRFVDLDRRAVLWIVPQGKLAAAPADLDRSQLPAGTTPAAYTPPVVQEATLPNGLKLYLVEKRELPLVETRVVVRAGWADDPLDRRGTAVLTADMLDEGAGGRDALALSEAVESLGAELRTSSNFDGTQVSLNVLRGQLDAGLALLGDVLLRPSFPEKEFERLRQSYRGRQKQEASQPQAQALNEFQLRCFGETHPYAQPASGVGTPGSLEALSRADLRTFHGTWYVPGNAAVVIVGDLDLPAATAAVGRVFGGWKNAPLPGRPPLPVPDYRGPRLVVIDRPGAQQSQVLGGYVGMARGDADHTGFEVVNSAFGGQFASRINLNLREDKGYTYGARSQLSAYLHAGVFLMTAPVQTDATAASVRELLAEMAAIRGERPLTGQELADSRARLVQGFPQRFETYGGTARQLGDLLLAGLTPAEWQNYRTHIANLTEADLAGVIARHLDPSRVVWVIVGDWNAIRDDLRDLGLGEIEVVGAERS